MQYTILQSFLQRQYQGAALAAVRAAFVYNFVKFAEWPTETTPPGTSLVLCAIDAKIALVAQALGLFAWELAGNDDVAALTT